MSRTPKIIAASDQRPREDCPFGLVPAPGRPFEERHLVRMLEELARIVTDYRDGHVYLPLFERTERELTEVRRRADPIERARRLAKGYTEAGGLNAIR